MGSKAHTVDFIRKRLERELDQVRLLTAEKCWPRICMWLLF